MGEVVSLFSHLPDAGKQNLLWQEWSSKFKLPQPPAAHSKERNDMEFKDGNLVEIMQNGLKELVCIVTYSWPNPQGEQEADVRFAWLAKEFGDALYASKLKPDMQPVLVADDFDAFTRAERFAPAFAAALGACGLGEDPLAVARVAHAAVLLKTELNPDAMKSLLIEINRADAARHARLDKVLISQGLEPRHG